MPTIPAPVDDDGNITVPAEGGVTIPIREQDNQVPPQPVDISAIPLRFYVRGRIDKDLVPDPNNALGQLLVITETEADTLGTSWKSFQLLDESDLLVPVPVWSGTIRRGS